MKRPALIRDWAIRILQRGGGVSTNSFKQFRRTNISSLFPFTRLNYEVNCCLMPNRRLSSGTGLANIGASRFASSEVCVGTLQWRVYLVGLGVEGVAPYICLTLCVRLLAKLLPDQQRTSRKTLPLKHNYIPIFLTYIIPYFFSFFPLFSYLSSKAVCDSFARCPTKELYYTFAE